MHRTLRRALLCLALAVPVGLASGTTATTAAAQTASASSFLDGKLNTVRTLLKTPASPDREKKLDAELATLVDYDEMAKVALGKEYGNRTKEEIAEITVDIIPEGSSMAKTYNKDFTKVIKKDGWATLIKKMKDKLAKP